jgi:hypothetical protein
VFFETKAKIFFVKNFEFIQGFLADFFGGGTFGSSRFLGSFGETFSGFRLLG